MSSRRNCRLAATARGFTMVDTMVASIVMIVGTVGLLSMQMTQISAGLRGRQLSEATALMQQKLEELRLLPLPEFAYEAAPQSLDARGCPVGVTRPLACATPMTGGSGTVYHRTWRIAPQAPGVARIEVQVSWLDPQGQSHQVSFAHDR